MARRLLIAKGKEQEQTGRGEPEGEPLLVLCVRVRIVP